MSLSFEESLRKNIANTSIENTVAETAMIADDISVAIPSIMTLNESYGIAAYSGDDGNWQQHTDYVRYSSFSDDNISVISDKKDITLHANQFNITQEENSQYIPFEMPRYYDGYDLVNTAISVHYTTKTGRHVADKPVNVTFNDNKIRFGWLVNSNATIDAGTLEFEIHAYGTVTGSDGVPKGYVWKIKSNKNLNVAQSMCDCEDAINDINDSWIQELVTDIAEKVADEIKNVAVGEQVTAAENAAASAEQSAESARQYASNASSAATNAVNEVLQDYATQKYVDDAVDGVDVTEQLASYVKTSDLEENYYNKTDASQLINSTIESKGYATEDYVNQAIESADLDSYYKKEETYSKTEVDEKVANVKVDLTGYATETYVDNKTGILSSSISDNADSITGINSAITTINQTLESLDKSPRITYDATYGDVELDDGSTAEYMFTLWKTENGVREVQDRFQIAGGGGGK